MQNVCLRPKSRNRLWPFIAITSTLFCGGRSNAQPAASNIKWHKIGTAPGFPGLRQELGRIASRRSHAKVARFCVVVRDTGDRNPILYALWSQEHLLYRWESTKDPQIGEETLLHHTPLDLSKDIIRTESDKLSSYKVTQSWVMNVEKQCSEHGEQLQIVRGKR